MKRPTAQALALTGCEVPWADFGDASVMMGASSSSSSWLLAAAAARVLPAFISSIFTVSGFRRLACYYSVVSRARQRLLSLCTDEVKLMEHQVNATCGRGSRARDPFQRMRFHLFGRKS